MHAAIGLARSLFLFGKPSTRGEKNETGSESFLPTLTKEKEQHWFKDCMTSHYELQTGRNTAGRLLATPTVT
eukprot:1140241-Pelagomonas_calceolata.AAC.1